jgi:hypothetical protein
VADPLQFLFGDDPGRGCGGRARAVRPVPRRARRSSPCCCVDPPAADHAATQLDSRVAAEIQRILPLDKPSLLLGGTGALSRAVEDQVKVLGYTTIARLAGPGHFATALAVGIQVEQFLGGPPLVVLVATGRNFPMRSLPVQPRGLGRRRRLVQRRDTPNLSVTMWFQNSRRQRFGTVGRPGTVLPEAAAAISGAGPHQTAVFGADTSSPRRGSPLRCIRLSGITAMS